MTAPHRLALTILLAVCVVAPATTHADCAPVSTRDEIGRSDLIFVGTVTSVGDRRVTFRVTAIFKGQVGPWVSSQMNPRRFFVGPGQVGQRFVIFMRRSGTNEYRVNGCGNSQNGAGADRVVAELRAAGLRGRPPPPPPPPG